MNTTARLVDSYHRRLEDRNPLPTNEHQRVRRTEVYCKLATALETPLNH
jgi:hypothetical protein